MDNHEDMDITKAIATAASRVVVQHTSNPSFRSEIIGEVMYHTALNMLVSASNYLTIQPGDVMVTPLPTGSDLDAVLLTRTITRAAHSYTLVVRVIETDVPGEFEFDTLIYVPNDLNTIDTKFVSFPEAHQAELIRQLKIISKNAGNVMLCVTVVPQHFANKENQQQEQVEAPPQSVAEIRADAAENKKQALMAAGGLPPEDPALL